MGVAATLEVSKHANIAEDDNAHHADRKLLETYRAGDGYSQWEANALEDQAGKRRRGLAQTDTVPGVAPAPAPGPAPGPETESVWPSPPTSPFVPPSNDSSLACCCRSGNTAYEEPYQTPPPAGCCCGSRTTCCQTGGLVNMICGGGQVCGILMLLSALVAVLVLSVCVTGSYFARRRRQNVLALHAANTTAGGPTMGMYRPASQALEIPPDQLELLRVRPAVALEGGEESDTTKECPICLDTVALHPDTWAVFPCTHGCCRPCLGDLMRLSSRRVNDNTLAVLCPLCRKIAVAPENMELESEGGIGAIRTMASTPSSVGVISPNTPALPSPVAMEVERPSPAAPGLAENTTSNVATEQGGSRWNLFNNRQRRWM